MDYKLLIEGVISDISCKETYKGKGSRLRN